MALLGIQRAYNNVQDTVWPGRLGKGWGSLALQVRSSTIWVGTSMHCTREGSSEDTRFQKKKDISTDHRNGEQELHEAVSAEEAPIELDRHFDETSPTYAQAPTYPGIPVKKK